MTATELMIGDWVCYNKPNGYLTRVDDIRRTGDERLGYVYSITCKRDKRDPLHENIPVDAFNVEILHPIPLTPEILVSNGFVLVDEKDKMYRCEYGDAAWVNADFKAKEPWAYVTNTCYHSVPYCPYLHQLQHALLSCGIVKELKPDMPGDSPLADNSKDKEG